MTIVPFLRRICATRSRPVACAAGLLLAGVGALPAADEVATDYWVRVLPSLWSAKLGGDFTYQDNGTTGSKLETGELGLGSRENSFAVEAGAQIPFLFGFHVGLSNFTEDASTTLSRTVTFGSQTYTAGDRVDTHVGLRDWYGEICVRPINFDVAGFSVGVAVHAVKGDLGLSDQNAGFSDELSKTVPVPTLSLRAHVAPLWLFGIKSLTLEGRLHYLDLSISGDHLRYADVSVMASYRPIDYLGITGGYRYNLIDLKLDHPADSNSSADIDLHLQGPFIGLIAKF